MPLPSNFSPFEHLQDTFVRVHNELVRDEFSDLTDDDDLQVPRSSLRVACKIVDDDSGIAMIMKSLLLMAYLHRARDFHPPLYAIPADTYQEQVMYQPQVILRFHEDLWAVQGNKTPVHSRISFRVHNETAQTITPADALRLGQAINREFGTGGGYRFSRGKQRWLYLDKPRGYDLRLHVTSESEARQVINKVHDIRGHTPDWERLTQVNSNRAFPDNPGTELIYGKARPKVRRRPRATVRFQYAELHMMGLREPVILCDRTGLFPKALVKA